MYLFSPVIGDLSLKDLKNLKQIRIDDSYEKDPIVIDDLGTDCLCLFDDVDAIQSKNVFEQVMKLQNDILITGRHRGITCLITYHSNGCSGRLTKLMLLESNQIVLYLNSGCNYNRLLQTYFGLSLKQIKYLKSLKTRYIVFDRAYQQLYYTQHKIGLLKDVEELK